jgi:hypothetical protein
VSEGNYLQKRRKNFYLTADCCKIIIELAYKLGVSESGVLELAGRELYQKEIGEFEWSKPVWSKATAVGMVGTERTGPSKWEEFKEKNP